MKNSKLLASLSLTAILIQSTQAQQQIPDEINYKPFEQSYKAAKAVSDKKRSEANKAQQELQASKNALQAALDRLSGNESQVRDNDEELRRIDLEQQALDNQIRTNNALIARDKNTVNQKIELYNAHGRQLQQVDQDQRNARLELDRAEENRRNAANLNKTWEDKLRAEQADLDRAERALREHTDKLKNANRDKDQKQERIVQLSQDRSNQETAITTAQAKIEPARRQVQDLGPKVEQKAAELKAANDREKTAQDAVNRDQKALDAITSQNGPLNDQISKLRTQTAGIRQGIEQQKSLYQSTQSDLQNAEKGIAAQKDRKEELTRKQKETEQKRDRAQKEFESATLQKDKAQKDLNEAQAKLRQYTRADQDKPEVKELQKKIEELKALIKTLADQIQAASSTYASANTELGQIGSDLAKANAEIKRLTELTSNGPSALAAIQSKIDSETSKLKPLADQLADLERKLAAVAPQQQAAEAALKASKAELATAKTAADNAERDHRSLKGQLETAQKELKSAQDTLAQNQGALDKTKKEIESTLAAIETLKNTLKDLEQKKGPLEGAVRVATGERDKVLKDTELSRKRLDEREDIVRGLNRRLHQIREARRDIERARDDLDREIIGLNNGINGMQDLVIRSQDQVKNNLVSIKRLQDDNHSLVGAQPALVRTRDQAQAAVNQDQDQYAMLDQQALSAETLTESRRQQYATRKDRYDQLLAEAVETGRAEGERVGLEEGLKKGRAEGIRLGKAEGEKLGKDDGLAAALATGRAKGKSEGALNGSRESSMANADYAGAYREGEKQGQATAAAQALAQEYETAKKDQFTKLTATLPSRQVQLDQNKPSAPPLGQSSGRQSLRSVEAYDATIDERVCSQSFADFKKACATAYATAKAEAVTKGEQDGYSETHDNARDEARAKTKAEYENDKDQIKKGYTETYGAAYAEAAKAKGITDGQAAGYKAVRQTLGEQQTARGIQEITDLFASQPVTQLKDAKLVRVGLDGSVGGAIGASDQLKLELTVANHGARASGNPPVRVEMKALTSGLKVTQSAVALTSIPAATTAVVSNVLTVKVPESATSGGQEQLQLTYSDEQGRTRNSVLRVSIQPNLKVSLVDVDYDSTPKVGRAQKVNVVVRNDGDLDPTEAVTVGLSTQAPAGAVQIDDDSEMEVKGLDSGRKIKARGLRYTVVNEQALRAGITMTVYVKHGARIVAKQDFSIRK